MIVSICDILVMSMIIYVWIACNHVIEDGRCIPECTRERFIATAETNNTCYGMLVLHIANQLTLCCVHSMWQRLLLFLQWQKSLYVMLLWLLFVGC